MALMRKTLPKDLIIDYVNARSITGQDFLLKIDLERKTLLLLRFLD
jgi:hypothetical protein